MTLQQLAADIRYRMRALIGRTTLDRDLDEEVNFHIDREMEKHLRRGVAPDEAARLARRSFGGVDRIKAESRRARGTSVLETTGHDIAYAIRALRRTPAFTVSTVLVLALGIGASTATYSAVHAVLIAHLPYPNDDQLVRIVQQDSPENRWTLSTVDFRAIEDQQQSFSAVGAMSLRTVAVSAGDAPPTATRVGLLTSGVLRALEVPVARGRPILPTDEAVDADPVMLVSHAFASRTFGGDSAALGSTITVDGAARTIVGVLPPTVTTLGTVRSDLWSVLQLRRPQRRGPFGLAGVARLRDGVSPEMAARDLAGISRRIFPIWQAGFQDSLATLTPVPLREWIIGTSGRTMEMVAAAVLLVLLTAMVNVANLVLVRATSRAREVALRSALGATRGRLIRLVVTESFVVSMLGAAAGLAVAWAMLRVFVTIGTNVARLSSASLDGGALAFAAGLAVFTGIAIGLYPVIALVGHDLAPTLHGGERAIGAGRRTNALRGILVAAEFAFALPLLAGAGVLARSVVQLQRVNPGYDPDRVAYVQIGLPAARYDSSEKVARYWREAIDAVSQIPGVDAVGYSTELPPFNVGNENNFYLADRPPGPRESQPTSPWLIASPGYFDAMGMHLLGGRVFAASDTIDPVAIVSASWVRHYSPDLDAVGRRLVAGGCVTCTPTTIIGVVSDVKYDGLNGSGDGVYVPAGTRWSRSGYLFAGTTLSSSTIVPYVRRALGALDGTVPLDQSGTMADRIDLAIAAPRNWTSLLGGFAAVALALAAVGIFGVLSYTVSARRREIGVRLALGAKHAEIVGMVVRRGMGYGLAGAAVGLLVAVLGRSAVASQLFEVSATDPLTLGGVTLLLLGVAWVACWMAARRTATIDPIEVMRAE
jgi:predicted permease